MAAVFAIVERGTFAIDGYEGDNDEFPTMWSESSRLGMGTRLECHATFTG